MKLALLFFSIAVFLAAAVTGVYGEEESEYEFNESEFEKKTFSFGGYAELFSTLYLADKDAALYHLNYHKDSTRNPYTDEYLRLVPDATFEKGILRVFLRAYGFAGYSNDEWSHDADLYEGYVTIKPNQHVIADIGKKTMLWGKGYAWNPAAFLDRPKNPDDPELAREGYVIASADFTVSLDRSLKTITFTPVFVPEYKKVNDDFGKTDGWNFAGKLYLLFFDTDIDLIFLAGDSRGNRYGADISRNITSSFEIHGEFAYIPDFTKRYLDDSGIAREKKYNAASGLAGIRYLTEKDTTYIIEYYYNGTGMSKNDMQNYYNFIDRANSSYLETGNEVLFERASMVTEGNYGKMTPMKNYIYFRASQKEPFDILYFTPALASIINIDDSSFSMTPELLYTGINNFEFRFRYTWLYGRDNTEFGEKVADHKIDLRVRYYF